MVQIEAILNSKPLVSLSNDPKDLGALTPGHLLIGDCLLSSAEPNLYHLKLSTLSRWQHLENIRQHFWRRWSKEYISSLQRRTKWQKKGSRQVKVGDLVIIQEENTPPLLWPLARVVEVHTCGRRWDRASSYGNDSERAI